MLTNTYKYDIYKTPLVNQEYQIVIVHDGSKLFDQSIIDVIEELQLKNLLIVAIDPNNRLDDFTPWQQKALTNKFDDFGGKANNYLDYIFNDLYDTLSNQYPINKKIALVGSSLGGLVSMYAATIYSKQINYIGSISGSYWYPNICSYILNNPVDKSIYYNISFGLMEAANKTTIQKDMVRNNHIISNYIKLRTSNHTINFSLEYEHNTRSFKERLIKVLIQLNTYNIKNSTFK